MAAKKHPGRWVATPRLNSRSGRRSLHGVSRPRHLAVLTLPFSSSHCAAGSPCPTREVLPEKLSWHVAIDLTKCCCKRSLAAWSVIRMKLRFIEVLLLTSQEYLSEFSRSPFAWRQGCADAQSLPFLFLQQQTLFFLKTRRVKPPETKTYVRG